MCEEVLSFGSFAIDGLEGERQVRVFSPARRDGGPRPPVVVLFDGQNVFCDEGSFSGGWHAHAAAAALVQEGLVPPVVVAIHHGGASRIDELGPWPSDRGGGKLDALLRFAADQLLPAVADRFGASTNPEDVIIGGSSMGGLAALYCHFTRPDRFGGALAMSPSLWFAGREAFAFVARRDLPAVSRIYLDAGAKEDGGGMQVSAESLAAVLRGRGYGPDRLELVIDPEGTHAEADWKRRFPAAMRFLLGRGQAERRLAA
jgi:predicted alpha/beta superfamily hydrolase